MASTIPGPARDFVRVLTQAVDTAISGEDAAAYDTVTAQLAALLAAAPAGGRVLGDVLRSLLEDTHPDGLRSDDITLLIGRCYRASAAWLPPERVDVIMLLRAGWQQVNTSRSVSSRTASAGSGPGSRSRRAVTSSIVTDTPTTASPARSGAIVTCCCMRVKCADGVRGGHGTR